MNDTEERVEVKRILVAVDGSEHSLKAVQYACAIGPSLGAETTSRRSYVGVCDALSRHCF
jgi:nucleotide-binding universal stress UspA family protein